MGGGKIVYDVEFSANDDYSSYIKNIKRINPDIIYLVAQWSNLTVNLIDKIKSAGIDSNILSSEVIFEINILNDNNGNLDGVFGIKTIIDEENQKFKQFLKDTNNSRLSVLRGYSQGLYDIIFLIKESYEAGGDDPNLASKYLYDLDNWEGVVGKINFDQNGNINLPVGAYMIYGNDIELVNSD